MENKNIATFIKVVEFNNFTKAADSLGYSQAAVTAQIKALETELGVPLFDRIGRGIALTQAGRAFLPYALEMLNAEAAAKESVRSSGELVGELRIASASSYANGPLSDIIMRFMELNPKVSVTVKISDFPEDTMRKLLKGEIDFLIVMGDESRSSQFRTVASSPEPLVFVTHPSDPLTKKKSITLSDAVNSRFIVADREIGYCAMLDNELKRCGIESDIVLEMGSVEAIIKMIRGGFGRTFVPLYTVSQYLENGELAELKVKDLDIRMNVNYLCSKERWIDPVMREFIRIVKEETE